MYSRRSHKTICLVTEPWNITTLFESLHHIKSLTRRTKRIELLNSDIILSKIVCIIVEASRLLVYYMVITKLCYSKFLVYMTDKQ